MIRKKLQLVGVTAMLIACKYEEVSVPTVEDFILITDKAYTRDELLDMVSSLCFIVLFLFLFPFFFLEKHLMKHVPIGEIDDEHLAIQLVCAYSIHVHEKIS